MRLLLTMLLLMIAVLTSGAQGTIKLKGQVVHNKKGPLRNFRVIIDNQYDAVTNDNGVFIVVLPSNYNMVSVSLPDTRYRILYPRGQLIIPRDLQLAPMIVIGSPADDEYLHRYLELYAQVKNRHESDPAIAVLQKQLDSMSKTLLTQNFTNAELENARRIQDGKEANGPAIIAALSDYRTNAYNLKSAFKYVSDFAFDNSAALARLSAAIYDYNNSFNTLQRQRFIDEKHVSDYWQDDSLRNMFHMLTNLALDTIHAQTLYPLAATNKQINEYFSARNKDEALKASIRQEVSKAVSELELLLPRLDAGTNEISQALTK